LSHFTAIKQKHNELVTDYMRRFRNIRNRCFTLNIFDKDLADSRLSLLLKEKIESHTFSNVSQVLHRTLDCESQAKESRGFTRSSNKPRNEHHVNMVKYSSRSSDDEEDNMCVSELNWASKSEPFVSCSLKLASKN
jgi:hypothetical protein